MQAAQKTHAGAAGLVRLTWAFTCFSPPWLLSKAFEHWCIATPSAVANALFPNPFWVVMQIAPEFIEASERGDALPSQGKGLSCNKSWADNSFARQHPKPGLAYGTAIVK